MSKLATIIKDYAAQAHINYSVVRDRVMAKAATANNDLFPTIDRNGRLHAPCDGYEWDGDIYAGGSYLPFPVEFWEMLEELTGKSYGALSGRNSKSFGPKQRIKVTLEEANEIKEACESMATVDIGKVWDDGVSCYVYIQTTRPKLIEIVSAYRQEVEAEIQAKKDAEKAARLALKGKAPVGKTLVRGRIICFKVVEREKFSYYDSGVSYKMLVELENKATVWGSQIAKIDADLGDLIEFCASFEPSNDDPTHAFYKRPSKAKLIAKAS